MIRSFTVENFYSIYESQTLDLRIPKNAPDLSNRFAQPIPSSEERFPKVVVIFGANASGKTNILKAISFLIGFVKDSVDYRPEEGFPFLKFFNNEGIGCETKFKVEFDAIFFEHQKYRAKYVYELEIGPGYKQVSYEALKHFPEGRPRRLFERRSQNIKFSSEFNISDNDPVLNRIRPNASVISTLAKFNDPIATAIYRNLNAVMSNVSAVGKDDTSEKYATRYYNENNEALEELSKQIRKFDFGIQNIKLLKTENGIEPIFNHKGLNVDIRYDFESQGTQSFYSLFPYIYFVLQSGGIAVLDELGGDFHPLLLPEIVKIFQHRETNPYDAQLIMTCLNATLFESLEKEEIFFTEKTESGETQIYGAKNITGVRRDTNIYAKYLLGALGGIPVVG